MRVVQRCSGLALICLLLVGGTLSEPIETVLYIFKGGSDGYASTAALIDDKEGALYGTTIYGGSSGGIVFKLTPPDKGQTAWTETVLYRFCSLSNCSDGNAPQAGLIADKEGALYGTTAAGGRGGGTVFKLTPPVKDKTAWTETVLYSFVVSTAFSDGVNPSAPLIADGDGALYGTTYAGGAAYNSTVVDKGTVFKLTPPAKGETAWTETLLYVFAGGSDGAHPRAGLIADKQGALYGTTVEGGSGDNGTVFKLTPPAKGQTGWTETVLYRFCSLSNCSDGSYPAGGLIADERGALYGTTLNGGNNNFGTVFKLTPPAKGHKTWTETVLYRFCSLSNCSDGAGPFAENLIADRQGALYGTTTGGGIAASSGTVFKLTPAEGQTTWIETVLYKFTGGCPTCGSDGAYPQAGLTAGHQGALYGTTVQGGSDNFGTVFKLALCSEPTRGGRREKSNDNDQDHNRCPFFPSKQ